MYLFSIHLYRIILGRRITAFRAIPSYIQLSIQSNLLHVSSNLLRLLALLRLFWLSTTSHLIFGFSMGLFLVGFFTSTGQSNELWFVQACHAHCGLLFQIELYLIYFHTYFILVPILVWNNLWLCFLFLV